ncbi:hypothetical protein SAMN03080594_11612 [Arenibacter palladensis]|uniref:Uncharacterized protein n=1 Tax=Arenibacter palladensis TaxID=237373 RepID=A0A1M5HMB3_9FLAO|nr:hypothetical protein SAMN03080594_11612 [Arenibacter palladensis]
MECSAPRRQPHFFGLGNFIFFLKTGLKSIAQNRSLNLVPHDIRNSLKYEINQGYFKAQALFRKSCEICEVYNFELSIMNKPYFAPLHFEIWKITLLS